MTAHSEDYDMIPPANKPTAKFDAELEKIVKDVLETTCMVVSNQEPCCSHPNGMNIIWVHAM